MINKRKLALLYYTIIDAIDYDMNDKQLLRLLDNRFANTPTINKEILLKAIDKYNELLAKEFEELVRRKCNE